MGTDTYNYKAERDKMPDCQASLEEFIDHDQGNVNLDNISLSEEFINDSINWHQISQYSSEEFLDECDEIPWDKISEYQCPTIW